MLLRDFIADNAIPRKNFIHDCVDTGADLVLLDGVEVDFPCDCVGRDYKSTNTKLWYPLESIIRDTIDDTKFMVEFNFTLNGLEKSHLEFRIFIPHPTEGDIVVKTITAYVRKNNIDDPLTIVTMLYNAIDSNAKTYGFKVKIKPVGGNITLKYRSVLIGV